MLKPALAGAHRSRIAEEKAAFGIIRGLSILTIVILGLIVGFILLKGLRFSNETRSSVLPVVEAEPDGLALVVNHETEMRRIDFPVLYGMFTDEYINWSKISADDFELLPVAVEGTASSAFLFGDPSAAQWGSSVKRVRDSEAALALVDSTPGAAALVGAEALRAAKAAGKYKNLSLVPIRRRVLAVNDDAAALVDNRSLEDLDEAAVARLLGGSVSDWKELGGPDLKVKLLSTRPPVGSGGPELAGSIAATSGAVGELYAADAQAAGLQTLTIKGVERGWNLTLSYLLEGPRLSGKVGGISTIILNTFLMLILTIAMAAPIGVAAAVYLIEYAKQGPLVRVLRLGTETLAGIPSIIFGLFGFLFFVNILHLGFGLLSGCLTLTLMILPTIVRTSEEALKSVSPSLREGSLALGATKLQTILRVTIPAAAPGILTGLILGVGRAVGETAALIFTMGSDYKLAKGLFSSARVLSSHVYLLFAEGISFDRAFSTATVLIAIVLVFNFAARRLIGRMGEN